MGNGIDGSTELEGATSLELALDRATDQYMAAMQERRGRRRSTGRTSTTAMVVDDDPRYLPARLSWKGIEVTEEFQEYAMRVARGEQLEPYRGQVLAHPCPDFPWSEPANAQEHTSTESLPHFRSRGPRVAAWIFGIGALVMAAIGIGSGTANPEDELGALVLPPTMTALALRPTPREDEPTHVREVPETRIASAIESALAHAAPVASDPPRATSRAQPSPGIGLTPLGPAPRPPTSSAAIAPSNASSADGVSAVSASLAALGALSPNAVTSATAGQRTNATSSQPGGGASASLASSTASGSSVPADPTRSSALFSDRAPF